MACKYENWQVIDAEMNKDWKCTLHGGFCINKCKDYVQDPSIEQLLAEKLIDVYLDSIKQQITLNHSFTKECQNKVIEACDTIHKLMTED